jgi:hypothetical protein
MQKILLAVCSVIFLDACSNGEKYAANQAAANTWLIAHRGASAIRVDGAWEALEFGWGGAGRFVQSGNTISGALGNYTVKGSVRGSEVYLTFYSDGWTYYTAELRKRGDTLGGFYSASIPFANADQGSLTLRRISD